MKNLLFLVALLACMNVQADTTPPVTFPTTADNAFLNGQVIVTLINHGSFAEEYRKGQKQVVLSDNIIEAGHVNGQYVFAFDGSVYQDPRKTGLDYETGIRLNLHSLVNKYVAFTPEWAAVIGNLEYYPRVGYDFGTDKAHAWIATLNLGFGFGAGAGAK